MRPVTAIILAAGKPEIGIQTARAAANPAMVKFNGHYMYKLVVEALGAAQVGQIILVGEVDREDTQAYGFQVVPGGKTPRESLQNGLDAASFDRVLVLTVDLPLLKPKAITGFLDDCNGSGNDLCYSAAEVERCTAEYPGVKRTSFRFTNGEHLTGGNFFYGSKHAMLQVARLVNRLYKHRKNPIALAQMFGWSFAIRALLAAKFKIGQLNREELIDRASTLLGLQLGLVICDPSAATDADNLEQLQALEALARPGGRKVVTAS